MRTLPKRTIFVPPSPSRRRVLSSKTSVVDSKRQSSLDPRSQLPRYVSLIEMRCTYSRSSRIKAMATSPMVTIVHDWVRPSRESRPSPISISRSSSEARRSSLRRPRKVEIPTTMARFGIDTPSRIVSTSIRRSASPRRPRQVGMR